MIPPGKLHWVGEAGVADMTEYVLSLSGREQDSDAAQREFLGEAKSHLISAYIYGMPGE